MTHRLTWALVTFLSASCVVAACSSDGTDGSNSGNAGDSSGGETAAGGSAAGGSTAGKAGSASGGAAQGGKAGSGGQTGAGRDSGGNAGLGGAPGAAGAPEVAGGPAEIGGAAGAAGAPEGGAAGAPAVAIDYACTSNTWAHKICSAQVAMNCPDPTDCSDCVTERNSEYDSFADCSACLGEYEKFIQCGVDAYESHQLSLAFECVDGFGADLNENCYPFFDSALKCQGYQTDHNHECPATWPVN